MGGSEAIGRLIALVNSVAGTDYSVVIQGETGAGKELVARAIHSGSARAEGPFIAVDCGAIPENLIESELFGHEKGAYTGAHQQRCGKFEAANGGTLFLDEISNLSFAAQAKMLRVLQENCLNRIGSHESVPLNLRLIVASNRDLREEVLQKRFREDLYYRLMEFEILVPALRNRREDIPGLVSRFTLLAARELRKPAIEVSPRAMHVLQKYDWPGNVRELRAVVRRAALVAHGVIEVDHLPAELMSPAKPLANLRVGSRYRQMARDGLPLKAIMAEVTEEVERDVLLEVMAHCHGNKAKAARQLQVDYKTLLTKLKKYEIPEAAALRYG
jgi:DNA-binding NtrC family response regulator